jgi:hypothetical protein
MRKGLMTAIVFPFLLLWSLFYGVVGGIFFKILAVYENWAYQNQQQLIQWKRYPQRSYNKFVSAILTYRMLSRPMDLVSLTNNQIRQEYDSAPFPFLPIIFNTVVSLIVLPFAMISGAIFGPVFVCKRSWQYWRRYNQSSSAHSES